jgi:uncharacterized RDD family membrane protein YckC
MTTTTTADAYIDRVLDFLPGGTPERDQIATELRGHIAERLGSGLPLAEVLRQLGDPLALAESYLAAVPMRSASFGRRAVAKLVDIGLILAFIVPITCLSFFISPDHVRPLVLLAGIFCCSFLSTAYLVVAEWRHGQTFGKKLMSLRVVRESGARIGLGQACVRQLPMFLQMYWIDVLFALFTDKHQRAFELLSKTRVIDVDPTPVGNHGPANARPTLAL